MLPVPAVAKRSRYTAANQYGMVGWGAGPGDMATPGVAAAAAGLSPAPAGTPAPSNGSPMGNLVMPTRMLEDPAFWMIATLGGVIFLAAYSAG